MANESKMDAQRRATYTALSSLFWLIFAVFCRLSGRKGQEFELHTLDFVQLVFASLRLGRLVAYDKVAEPYRAPFTETVRDQTGAGCTVTPKGEGAQQAIGELICCPICSGTWIAAGLVYGLTVAPGPTRVILAIMSSIGAAEVANAGLEALQWTGQAARVRAGSPKLTSVAALYRESVRESARDSAHDSVDNCWG